MADGAIGEQVAALSTRLADGIRGNALSLHLRLRVVLIGWLSQLKTRKRAKLLKNFPAGKIRRVSGKTTRGCSDTSMMISSYNRARTGEVKQDLRKWFSAIASCRIHAESRLAILKA